MARAGLAKRDRGSRGGMAGPSRRGKPRTSLARHTVKNYAIAHYGCAGGALAALKPPRWPEAPADPLPAGAFFCSGARNKDRSGGVGRAHRTTTPRRKNASSDNGAGIRPHQIEQERHALKALRAATSAGSIRPTTGLRCYASRAGLTAPETSIERGC